MAASRSPLPFSSAEDILSRLDKEPIAPLYLFYGDEPYLIDRAVTRVRRRMGDAHTARTFYAGEDSLDALLEAWGTPSLFATHTLVMLRSAERLKAAERERLTTEAALREATYPLIVCAHGRVDLTVKFFALCSSTGFAAEFRPPFAQQMPAWMLRLARERGVRLSEEATHLLADLVGPDLYALAGEIDKLAAFVNPRTEIGADDVRACAGDLHQHSAFDLADALGQRDREKAFTLLQRILADEREALPTLHALVSHFRRLWQAKELQASNTPEGQIERVVGLRGPRLRALLAQSRLYSATDLRRLFHSTAALDIKLKSTRVPPSALFAALVLDTCATSTEKKLHQRDPHEVRH